MDVAKLAKDIRNLRYETAYRFEFGAPSYQTLSEGDIRGILVALRDRGFTVSRGEGAHLESPPICAAQESEWQTTA